VASVDIPFEGIFGKNDVITDDFQQICIGCTSQIHVESEKEHCLSKPFWFVFAPEVLLLEMHVHFHLSKSGMMDLGKDQILEKLEQTTNPHGEKKGWKPLVTQRMINKKKKTVDRENQTTTKK
jgi:hypothetical protein